MSFERTDVSGAILVGGKSRRMGRDKAFLEVGGIAIFDRVLQVLREEFADVLLVGDRAERFTRYHLPVVPDLHSGSALGGVYTALFHAATEYVFVSSCDIPFASSDVLRYLVSLRAGFDAVVPVTAHGYEPLFAVYSKRCLGPIKSLLEQGDFCAYGYYEDINIRFVAENELAPFDGAGRCFMNVNTPDDLARVEKESAA